MGWTKLSFIESAYAEIGLAKHVFDLQPEDIDEALQHLDGMIGEWEGNGIGIGWNFAAGPDDSDLDTEMDIPIFALKGIRSGLALLIAPGKGKTPSPRTSTSAKDGYDTIAMRCIHMPEKQFPTRLPVGAGNRRAGTVRRNFFRPVTTIPPSERNEIEDNS